MPNVKDAVEEYCEFNNKRILSMDLVRSNLVKVRAVAASDDNHQRVEKLWFKISGIPLEKSRIK